MQLFVGRKEEKKNQKQSSAAASRRQAAETTGGIKSFWVCGVSLLSGFSSFVGFVLVFFFPLVPQISNQPRVATLRSCLEYL